MNGTATLEQPKPAPVVGQPHRVQLSRKKGWRKPENTVVVSKPTMWGNPFWKGCGCRMSAAWSYQVHLATERLLMSLGAPAQNHHMRKIAEHLHELRGKNLACWCPLDMPDCYCHAGVLLGLADNEVSGGEPLTQLKSKAATRNPLH